ncbi:MAG: hypothetical protein Q8Q52_01405, partial [Acidimicrobiia bacterium]|nr:hypothetical protein [Acidimicrobiia bacterium]
EVAGTAAEVAGTAAEVAVCDVLEADPLLHAVRPATAATMNKARRIIHSSPTLASCIRNDRFVVEFQHWNPVALDDLDGRRPSVYRTVPPAQNGQWSYGNREHLRSGTWHYSEIKEPPSA